MSKVIVITGASSGIGAAIAVRLGGDGHELALASRSESALHTVAAQASPAARTFVTDVTRRQDVVRLRDGALGAFGHIDVWINNAGRGISRAALELTDDEFDEMMSVNVKSALYGMQAIVPHFLERGTGHIINISSFLGRVPIATHRSAYSAAKAALNSLTANVRFDLREHPHVHVSLVMPGLVLTEFARNVLGTPSTTPPPWLTGPSPLPPGAMKPQTAEGIAAVVRELIEHPVAEVYTNPASHDVVRAYMDDVEAFEKNLKQ